MSKIYKSNIDLRILGEHIDFIVYASGSVPAHIVPQGSRFHKSTSKIPQVKSYNKQKALTASFDTNFLVEVIVEKKDGHTRMFLTFPKVGLKIKQHLTVLNATHSDLRLEVFKNSRGYFGFEQILKNSWGAYLSHRNYFNVSTTKANESNGKGALQLVKSNKGGQQHQLQMVLPGIKIIGNGISFDIDILIQKGGQYIHSLDFKNNLEDIDVVEGNTLDIKPVTQVTTVNKNIKLETTYIKLKQKDLVSRELLYDYKTQLNPQNIPANSLELIKSNVYAIENPLNLNVTLTNLGLTENNVVEIPYNVSRTVEDNIILPTKPILENGKEVYELNWSSEIVDNEIINNNNKCISLKFSNVEQLESFEESLKKQQIGLLEKYPVLNLNGQLNQVKRTYSSISQWVNRSQLNQFNDTSFVYNSDGKLDSILICPNKKVDINNNFAELNNKYTDGGEYTLENGEEYVGYYHINKEKYAMVGRTHTDSAHEKLRPIYSYAPIKANSRTDFLFTTFDKTLETYSAFTATTQSRYKFSDTYDVHISGASYSAKTTVPISNITRNKNLPLIGDKTKRYGPYVYPEAFNTNGGDIVLDESNPTNYFRVSGVTNGIYRFTYKAYFNVKYKDSQWCEYLTNSLPTGTTGNYPSNNYEIKRLINTSIIQAGYGETDTTLQDTGFKFYPGKKFRDGKKEYDVPTNTGILDFNFNVSLIKTTSAGTQTNLKTFTIKRSKLDGSANDYLTLDVANTDKSSSGTNVCVLSAVSSSTIFSKQIPVTLDTGLITISSGETIHLQYDSSWNSTSKGGFFGLSGGETDIDINLGHRLNENKEVIEAPWFRVVKSTQELVYNNLFFNASKESSKFKMSIGGVERAVKLPGALYLTNSDNRCGNITTPKVTNTTFPKLTFLDTKPSNQKLMWDVKSNRPTNYWQKMIESNKIKDYGLPADIPTLTIMKDNGVFCFYIPTYIDEDVPTCDFTFPQISQSYVIVNSLKNPFGSVLTHYIVVTPDCHFYKPCSGGKLTTSYNVLHKTRLDERKTFNENKHITIKGRKIKIINSRSHYNPAPTVIPTNNKCRYYCKCSSDVATQLNIDPIYNTTTIFTDLETENCSSCLDKANNYCKSLNAGCAPYLMDKCVDSNNYTISEDGKPILDKIKGIAKTNITINPITGHPVVRTTLSDSLLDIESPIVTFNCVDGTCFREAGTGGEYATEDACLKNCAASPPPPPRGIVVETPRERVGTPTYTDDTMLDSDEPKKEKVEEGICKTGYYWCESAGGCINEKIPCKEKI